MGDVLVLNKSWVPIRAISYQRAFILMFKERCRIVDPETYQVYTWKEWLKHHSIKIALLPDGIEYSSLKWITTGSAKILRPSVICLNNYSRIPKRRLNVSRIGIVARDSLDGKAQCQYCGIFPNKKQVTIDHILPKSRGGKNSWINCVVSCGPCNTKKGDRTPEEAGMLLIKQPQAPEKASIVLGKIKDEWRPFLKDNNE